MPLCELLRPIWLVRENREGDIRSAWRKKAKFFHPDAPYGNVTAFLQAKDAFETLIPPAPQAIRVRAGARSF